MCDLQEQISRNPKMRAEDRSRIVIVMRGLWHRYLDSTTIVCTTG